MRNMIKILKDHTIQNHEYAGGWNVGSKAWSPCMLSGVFFGGV